MTNKAELPTPAEELETQTKADEEELNQILEKAPKEGDDKSEELEEDSLPSDDEGQPEAEDQPDEESTEEEQPEVEEQEPKSLSKRAEKRYQDLTHKLKEKDDLLSKSEQEKQNLLAIVEALQDQGYTQKQAENLAPDINADPQDTDRIIRQAQLAGEQGAQRALLQEKQLQEKLRHAEQFQQDVEAIEEKYPELNQDSEEYDQKLDDYIAKVYDTQVKANPNLRVTDVVKEVMEIREKAAKSNQDRVAATVKKQASSQALSSSGGQTSTETLEDKLKSVDSEADLMELRKQIPLGD